MCIQRLAEKTKPYQQLALYTLMIVLGIVSGSSDVPLLKNIGLTIADIFIKIFRCISLPLIALSIIVTVSTYAAESKKKKLWQRTLFYTMTTTVIAATISCLLYLAFAPDNIEVGTQEFNLAAQTSISYWQYLSSLIPSNIFEPFIEYHVLGVLFVSIVLGVAIRYIEEEAPRHAVMQFFQGIHGIFLTITKWVVIMIPLGLYGFITATVVQLHAGIDISGLGEYLAVIVCANLIQGFIILPAWLRMNHIKPFDAMRKMMPALTVAFFSKSSAGTLPVTMETAEKKLHVDPKVSRFILPLCTSINMNGCAAFIFATVIYLMQNHGMEISLATMALWIIVATIAAIGNAGVPMGCFFLSASLLSSMNVPITLMGLILPFYTIIDMIETALNVWSDSCVAKVVNEHYHE